MLPLQGRKEADVLVLAMKPDWQQEILVEHGGESMRILIRLEGDGPRTRIVFDGPHSFKLTRREERKAANVLAQS